MNAARNAAVGWFMIVVGLLGLATGVVPYVTNGLRLAASEDLWGLINPSADRAAARGAPPPPSGRPGRWGFLDFLAHGVEAMGLSVEWGLLSAACGSYLGLLLLWGGVGWLRGRAWATTVTWAYVIGGLIINFTDWFIFLLRGAAGTMRLHMLITDAVAFGIPACLGAWLLSRKLGAQERPP